MIGTVVRPTRQRALGAAAVPRWRALSPAMLAPASVTPAAYTSHPLADAALAHALRRRADEIEAAFDAIEPALRALAPQQFDPDFVPRATRELRDRLGLSLESAALTATWTAPLDMRSLYARCAIGTYCRLIERAFDRDLALYSDGESAPALIARWGFHAVDITPCADGRLSGVVDYILRVPPAVVVSRRSFAGALFDVEETLRQWEAVELRRWREGRPNPADAPTRYLKIGVYHFSSVDPAHHGCAAHGSDTERAARAVLERLERFAAAVIQTQGGAASAATLLVGVDTDTDAIRVHVPDAEGRMTVARFVDSRVVYDETRDQAREAAKGTIRAAVAACAGVDADDARSEGMRWFCGYLLKNNIGQVDAVLERYGGAYAERGHTERLIVVGDAADDVQLRNVAFQAQMSTLEEGAADLDIGVRILSERDGERGPAVPVLVHLRYDPRIPGADDDARIRARRLRAAIGSRYAALVARSGLHVEAVVRAGDGSALGVVDSPAASRESFA